MPRLHHPSSLRIQTCQRLLKLASRLHGRPKPLAFRVLNCVKFASDALNNYIYLDFEIPRPMQAPTFVSLFDRTVELASYSRNVLHSFTLHYHLDASDYEVKGSHITTQFLSFPDSSILLLLPSQYCYIPLLNLFTTPSNHAVHPSGSRAGCRRYRGFPGQIDPTQTIHA